MSISYISCQHHASPSKIKRASLAIPHGQHLMSTSNVSKQSKHSSLSISHVNIPCGVIRSVFFYIFHFIANPSTFGLLRSYGSCGYWFVQAFWRLQNKIRLQFTKGSTTLWNITKWSSFSLILASLFNTLCNYVCKSLSLDLNFLLLY